MKTIPWFLACLMCIGLVTAAHGQETYFEDLQVYGFGSIIDYEGGDPMDIRWARVGIKAQPNPLLDMHTHFEYDLNDELTCAYGKLVSSWGHSFYSSLSVLAGQFLGPVAYQFDGPKTLPLTRWPSALNGFTIYTPGVGLFLEEGPVTVRTAYYGTGEVQAAVTILPAAFSVFMESGHGFGVTSSRSEFNWYLNPYLGWSKRKNTDTDYYETAVFIQNYIQLPFNSRCYMQVDYEEGLEVEYNHFSYLAGITVTYAENSFVKVFWDKQAYSGGTETVTCEMTFAF